MTAVAAPRPGGAFGILLRKELLESIRTFRLPVVAGLFLFVGLSSPVLARYLPEIIELAGGEQLGVIEIPTPTATDAVDQLVKNLAQFGALTAILLAMGLVASEKDRGTAAFILTKPVSRTGVPRRQARRPRRGPRREHARRRRRRLDLHRAPVRAAAGRRLDLAGDPRHAVAARVRHDHVPRQRRDRLHAGCGRDRVRGVAGARDRLGDPRARAS